MKTPSGKTAGNLNARYIFHYIRSLTPWQAHGEYRSLSIYWFIYAVS